MKLSFISNLEIFEILLLFFKTSLVIGIGRESQESEQSHHSLNIVNEIDIMQVLAFFNRVFRVYAGDSQT